MTFGHVIPWVSDQPSNSALNSITELRQHWQKPLRNYCFDINLPVLRHSEESPLPCREAAEDYEGINSEFSQQIAGLLDALVICQNRDAEPTREDSRYFSNDGLFLTINIHKQLIDHELGCRHRTYHSKRLRLEHPDTLPQVSCVTKLRILSKPDYGAGDRFANVRPVSLRVVLDLLAHMPAIHEIECPWPWEYLPIPYPAEPLRHYSRPWEGPWRDARHEFGRALQGSHRQIPASLRRARFWFFDISDSDNDQSVPLPNLIHPADTDPLSVGLCHLASHLEELDIRAILTREIFDTREISWPRMKHLRIEFHPMCSDGSWYFIGPRGENPNPEGFLIQEEHYPPSEDNEADLKIDEKHNDYEEEWYDDDERWPDMFCTEPTHNIEALLIAFAQRLKATPSIETAELFTYLSWYPSEARASNYEDPPYEEGVHIWGVKYTADGSKAVVEWQVGDWRPAEHVLEIFEALGRDEGIQVYWKEFEFMESRPGDPACAFV